MKPDIVRIGRPANPAENGLQFVIEHEEVLDHAAQNLFRAHTPGTGRQLQALWNGMCDAERGGWREKTIEVLRCHVAEYREPVANPDPKPPGASRDQPDSSNGFSLKIA